MKREERDSSRFIFPHRERPLLAGNGRGNSRRIEGEPTEQNCLFLVEQVGLSSHVDSFAH